MIPTRSIRHLRAVSLRFAREPLQRRRVTLSGGEAGPKISSSAILSCVSLHWLSRGRPGLDSGCGLVGEASPAPRDSSACCSLRRSDPILDGEASSSPRPDVVPGAGIPSVPGSRSVIRPIHRRAMSKRTDRRSVHGPTVRNGSFRPHYRGVLSVTLHPFRPRPPPIRVLSSCLGGGRKLTDHGCVPSSHGPSALPPPGR